MRLTCMRVLLVALISGFLAACTGPTLSPTVPPTLVSQASPTAPAAATSSPSVSPSPTPAVGWTRLATGDGAGTSWSPDGRWMLLVHGVVNEPTSLELRDAAGGLVRSLDGTSALWLDDASFLVFGLTGTHLGEVGPPSGVPVIRPLPIAGSPLSNGHGAIALAMGSGAETDAHERYAVWTRTGLTQGGLGYPVAWSADGARLAVWHFLSPGQGTGGRAGGWLQVVGWPGLRPLAAEHTHPTDIYEVFDPSGRYVAFEAGAVDVLDVASGVVTTADVRVPSDAFAWDAASHLVLPGADTGDLMTVDIRGTVLTTQPGVGDDVAASVDGSVIVAFWDPPGLHEQLSLIRGGTATTVGLPCRTWPDYGALFPQVAPRGQALTLTCAQDTPPGIWHYDSRG